MTRRILLPAVWILLCLLGSFHTFAQQKTRDKYRHRPTKDTIVVQIVPGGQLAIPVKSVRRFQVDSLNMLMQQLGRDLAPVMDSADTSIPTTVIYQQQSGGTRRVQVNTKDDALRSELYYRKENGAILNRTIRDSIVIERANGQKLFVVLDSLSLFRTYQNRNIDSLMVELQGQIAIDPQLTGMRDALIPFGGWLKVTLLDPINRQAGSPRRIAVDYSEDFNLGIITGVGVGLVRDKVVPEFGVGAAYQFPRSTAYIGIKFTWHYFFNQRPDASYKMDINTFMSIESGDKFKSGRGSSIGFLIHRSGNYFKGTTIKISQSLGTEKIGKIRLVPELIITDNFRVYFPGIRLGLMF